MIDYSDKNSNDGNNSEPVTWHSVALKYIDFTDKIILDLGCGSGGFLKYLKNKYQSKVYGLDPNLANVIECQKNEIVAYQGTADEVLKEHNSLNNFFDIVTSFEVLEHVYSYKEICHAMFSFLKKDGLAVATTPNAFHLLRVLSMIVGKHRDILLDPTLTEEPEHIRLYSVFMLERAFKKTGFTKIKTYGILKIRKRIFIIRNTFLIHFLSQHVCVIASK